MGHPRFRLLLAASFSQAPLLHGTQSNSGRDDGAGRAPFFVGEAMKRTGRVGHGRGVRSWVGNKGRERGARRERDGVKAGLRRQLRGGSDLGPSASYRSPQDDIEKKCMGPSANKERSPQDDNEMKFIDPPAGKKHPPQDDSDRKRAGREAHPLAKNARRMGQPELPGQDDHPKRFHFEWVKGCKERGEWAELCFMARAAGFGMGVLKPFGDSLRFDVGVLSGSRIWRVQVKSTIYRRRGNEYSLNVMGPGRKRYREGTVDFFAVYLIPEDQWYIIPYEALGKKLTVHFTPGGKRQKYARYLEAWELLMAEGSFCGGARVDTSNAQVREGRRE